MTMQAFDRCRVGCRAAVVVVMAVIVIADLGMGVVLMGDRHACLDRGWRRPWA